MKIDKIEISKFAGIDSAKIDLGGSGVVNFFCGRNGAGKSTVANAIEYALTGLTRDLTKKGEAKYLARRLEKGCNAKLLIDGLALTRTPSSCNMDEKSIKEHWGNPDMLKALINAWRIITLSPAERRALVQKITADPEKIKAEVLKHADADAGVLTAEDVGSVLVMAIGGKLAKAEDVAVQGRRAAGRELNQIAAAPPATVMLNGTEWSLADCDLKEMGTRLAGLKKQRDAELEKRGASKRIGNAEEIKADIEEIERQLFAEPGDEKKLERLEEQIAEAAKAIIDSTTAIETQEDGDSEEQAKLKAVSDKSAKLLAVDRDKEIEARTKKAAAKELYAQTEKLKSGSKCGTCQQKITSKHLDAIREMAIAVGNKTTAEYDKAEKRMDESLAKSDEAEEAYLDAKATALDAAKIAFDNAKEKHAALVAEHEIETAKHDAATENADKLATLRARGAECGKYQGVEEAINKLTGRIATGMRLVDAKQDYDRLTAAQVNRGLLEAQAQAWDTLAKALGKDGSVRKVAAEGFSFEPVLESAAELLPGREVTIDDEWQIYVDRIPARIILSESERLRLGAAFAAALSRASGVGLLVVDKVDLLEPELRPTFMGWLADQSESLQTVIAMATTIAPPAPQDWLKVWRVADGKCEEVKA